MTDSNQASAAARSAQLALRICTRPCGVTHDEKTDNAAEEEKRRGAAKLQKKRGKMGPHRLIATRSGNELCR